MVVRGPGSFTGMRIGLSTAKALAEACALPLLGASRLAVLAEKNGAKQVALYAGRGSVYLRTARAVPGQAQNATEQLLTAEEARLAIALTAAGVDGEQALAVCEERVLALFPKARMVDEPTAADALRHALPRLLAGEREDTATLDALYLWRESEMLGQAAPGRAAAG